MFPGQHSKHSSDVVYTSACSSSSSFSTPITSFRYRAQASSRANFPAAHEPSVFVRRIVLSCKRSLASPRPALVRSVATHPKNFDRSRALPRKKRQENVGACIRSALQTSSITRRRLAIISDRFYLASCPKKNNSLRTSASHTHIVPRSALLLHHLAIILERQ